MVSDVDVGEIEFVVVKGEDLKIDGRRKYVGLRFDG